MGLFGKRKDKEKDKEETISESSEEYILKKELDEQVHEPKVSFE